MIVYLLIFLCLWVAPIFVMYAIKTPISDRIERWFEKKQENAREKKKNEWLWDFLDHLWPGRFEVWILLIGPHVAASYIIAGAVMAPGPLLTVIAVSVGMATSMAVWIWIDTRPQNEISEEKNG